MSYDRQAQIRKVHSQRKASTDEKANAAIDALLKEKRPVNFSSVHNFSGIAVATLYKHEEVRRRIEFLRDQELGLPSPKDRKASMNDESKDAVIASLKRKIARLEEENKRLREINVKNLVGEWEEL